MKTKWIGIALLFAGFLVTAVGCSSESADLSLDSSIPVRVETVELKPMKEYVQATGTVYAIKEALLKVEQVGDYRLQVNPRTGKGFAMGDRVLKDEVVIVLDNPEYVNQVAIKSKKLNYEVSQREFEKQQRVYKKGGITLRELSDAERSYIDAEYNYENAKLSLEKLRITAPFEGTIVDLPYYSPGRRVEANATMVQVMDYSRLYTDVTLPGKEMGLLERNQTVTLTNYNSTDSLTGTVTQVSPSIDPDSRMFKLRIEIDNKDLGLKPGMFVKADIVVKEKQSTLVIPKAVVLDRRGSKTVFIVERGVARERRLETGMENREQIEVLDGLKKEERLVIEGFETLRHNSKVKVIK